MNLKDISKCFFFRNKVRKSSRGIVKGFTEGIPEEIFIAIGEGTSKFIFEGIAKEILKQLRIIFQNDSRKTPKKFACEIVKGVFDDILIKILMHV